MLVASSDKAAVLLPRSWVNQRRQRDQHVFPIPVRLRPPMRVSDASATLLDAVNEIRIAVPGKQAREDVD